MSSLKLSKNLCHYVALNEKNDLFQIVDVFSDNITDFSDNIYVKQLDVLDTIIDNIDNCKTNFIKLSQLYSNLDQLSINLIANLEIDSKIKHNAKYSNMLNIEYFDYKTFMLVVENKLLSIKTKYNLNANDDHNKLYKFYLSLKETLESSDDLLATLSNRYQFYKQHNQDSLDKSEYILIYGKKYYRYDLLESLLEDYRSNITIESKAKAIKAKLR